MPDLTPAPPEFNERIQRLIAAYFADLQEARIELQVRDTADGTQTVQAWGEADTPDNPSEARKFDFSIWFALDVWATLDDYQRDALAYHELMHCRFDDAGKPMLVDHDVEVFNNEIATFGLWWGEGAQDTLDAIENMPPPHGAEGDSNMPRGYRSPMQGSHGSSGAGSHGSSGAGSHGSSGAGSHGSSGAGSHGSSGAGSHGSSGAFADPHLSVGADFVTVPIGDGRTIDICPECWETLKAFVIDQTAGAMQGSHGSSGA